MSKKKKAGKVREVCAPIPNLGGTTKPHEKSVREANDEKE